MSPPQCLPPTLFFSQLSRIIPKKDLAVKSHDHYRLRGNIAKALHNKAINLFTQTASQQASSTASSSSSPPPPPLHTPPQPPQSAASNAGGPVSEHHSQSPWILPHSVGFTHEFQP